MSNIENRSEEITLLGLIAAAAEAWKWFVAVPILVALAVYLLLGQLAADYRSHAILRVNDTIALLTSSSVLRATIEELDMRDELGATMDDATSALARRLSMTAIAPGMTEVSLTARNAERAQEILATVIRNFAIQVAPRGQQREEIERQIAANEAAVNQLRQYAQSLPDGDPQTPGSATAGSNDAALGYVALVNQIQAKEEETIRLQRSLEGLTQADILQEPTLSDAPEASKRLVFALLAAVAAGLGILFIVIVGEVIRRAPNDPLASADLRRIRNAFRVFGRPSA